MHRFRKQARDTNSHGPIRSREDARVAGEIQADAIPLGMWDIRDGDDVRDVAGAHAEQAKQHHGLQGSHRHAYEAALASRLAERAL